MADNMDCNDTEFGLSNEEANNWADCNIMLYAW